MTELLDDEELEEALPMGNPIGPEGPALDDEDEALLDRIWEGMAKESARWPKDPLTDEP